MDSSGWRKILFWTTRDFFFWGRSDEPTSRISSNGRHWHLTLFFSVVDSSHHVTVSVRIIAARCCAIVGRGFFAPLSSLSLEILPPNSLLLCQTFFCFSDAFLICYSAARFHFCFIFGWFCRVVLHHTKSPEAALTLRSGKIHWTRVTFMMHLSWNISAFSSFFFFKQNVGPRFFYTKLFKSNGIEITSPHMYRVEIGAIFFSLRISV